MLTSLLLGLMVSAAFWAASEVSSWGASAMVVANVPAVAAGFIFSNNPHQPSSVAVFVAMVAQWALLSYVALWLFGLIRRKDHGLRGKQ
jgi:hypothetical protein